MLVQIYEVATPDEAIALAEIGVDHIGVLVGPGAFPRELSATAALMISDALPAGVKSVALSLSSDPVEVARVVDEVRPDIVHIGAAIDLFSPDETAAIKIRFPDVAIMRAIPVVGEAAINWAKDYDDIADWLLLDSHRAGDKQIGAQGITHDWALSRRIVAASKPPVILAGGLGPDNVADVIQAVGPAGVDSKTKTDQRDGKGKDLRKIRTFVAGAKGAR